MKKLITVIICFFFLHIAKAQNEFITVWQPSIISNPALIVNAPFQANINQIWFPGTGQNYTISWEEIGFPNHNGTMTNVTSAGQVLIDFGIPFKDDGYDATYRVKVSNGNGVFQQIKFASHQNFNQFAEVLVPQLQIFGSSDKLMVIEQWGNIAWTSMNAAFAGCQSMQLTATDAPNLSNVTNASLMFYLTNSFFGAPSMQNWDTSNIRNFSFMFARHHNSQIYNPGTAIFNPSGLSSWDVSSATDLSYMFTGHPNFNQNLNSWDVSSVKNMSWMFAFCPSYNQPLNNWDITNVEKMHDIFMNATSFNQNISSWNTTKVTNMSRAFADAAQFNQPLNSWNVSNVTKIESIFDNAISFNQSLSDWNLVSLTNANGAFANSGVNCENYSKTIAGWADNPNTANNVTMILNSPMQYASNVANKRNILIAKNWTITGDAMGSCILSISEINPAENSFIYPNPTSDFIFIRNVKNIIKYRISDASGRLIMNVKGTSDKIDVRNLVKGNYILELTTKENTIYYKFIKN